MTGKNTEEITVGVISDTHGTVLDGVSRAFKGVDMILHAGDIDSPEVLRKLEKIAPVTAVRGNMDNMSWAGVLNPEEEVQLGEVRVFIIHDRGRYHGSWGSRGCSLVVFGHTHKEYFAEYDGIYFLNPGSASAHAHSPSVALVSIRGKSIEPRFVSLLSC